jgi:hypothetical protein
MATVPDLDFDGLREQVEGDTNLPEFREVDKRARRIKRRHRLRNLVSVVAVVVPSALVVYAFHQATPNTATIGITADGSVVHVVLPTASAEPASWKLVAADGVDLEHLYGLVDVCSGNSCDLEVASIDPGGLFGFTQRIHLFRSQSIDRITDAKLVAVDKGTVTISARVNGGQTQAQTLLSLSPMPNAPAPRVTPRAVQAEGSSTIQVVRGLQVSPLGAQPALNSPQLVTAFCGWWVSGADPNTGAPALAVSHDAGKSWQLRSVGLAQIDAPPAIAGLGGTTYLMVSAGNRLTLRKSTDDGKTWMPLPGANGWPQSTNYGLIVTRNKALIAWITTPSGTVLVRSRDGGDTFTPYRAAGAAGQIVAVSDGYLMLGAKPAISDDGDSWASVSVPWQPLS